MVEAPRYSDADLAEFKEIILNKITKAQLDLIKSAYMNDLNNGTDDTHSKHLRKAVNRCQKKQIHN
jgi:hypothetical protein